MSDRRPSFECQQPFEQRALWDKLSRFPFDSREAERPFSVRLAAETGWSDEFTRRVVDEYRRFLFLNCVAGHVVCPSEQVDLAWHHHLTFTRPYWGELCQKTLGQAIHHDPTAGGPAAARYHWSLYQQTLNSYRRIFGEEPPRDIWPAPFDRFDPTSQHRLIELRDHWVLKKPRWWPRTNLRRRHMAFALLPLAAIGLSPFDLAGPAFLAVFFSLFAVAIVVAIILRNVMRDVPVSYDRDLTPAEVACLSFGRDASVCATIASMLHDGQLVSNSSKNWIGVVNGATVSFGKGKQSPSDNDDLALAIYRSVEYGDRTLSELKAAMASPTEEIESSLQEQGYLLSPPQLYRARLLSVIPFAMLLLFGITKVLIGFNRGRPVGFLLLGCGLVLMTAAGFLASFRRSVAGDQMVRTLKSQNSDLKTMANRTEMSHADVALCAALFGAAALDDSTFSDLKHAWRASSSAGGGGYGGSGCGGGGCGGGGCGGGGCGGCS